MLTVDLRMNKSPELPYYARLFESPELYWSFHKLCSYEAPLRRPFLKILYENADKCKKELDAETLKTSKLSNKIICRPPQSRETIPLTRYVLYKKNLKGMKFMKYIEEKQIILSCLFYFQMLENDEIFPLPYDSYFFAIDQR